MGLDEKVIWQISMTLQKKEVEEHKYFLSESESRGDNDMHQSGYIK